ncbi:MAG: hypothetical protein HYR86_04060 [Candidatus Rokubacteria bacterium]|nr:hypothetical protein [Candidatus Rokubacteria bacterium]
MANDFIKAFQPVEGLVAAINAEVVYVDIGARAGAVPGQELTVFRKAGSFVHPITGKTLGRYEQVLGYAQIRRVQANFSEAVFIAAPTAPAPRVEDGVRITRGRIRLAITPLLDLSQSPGDARRIPFMLASALERSKRFVVVDPLVVTDALAKQALRVEEVLAQPERAVQMAATLEVSAWLVPVLLERNGVKYLDATWISGVTGTPLFSRRQALVPPSALEEQRFPWGPRAED